MNVGRLLRARVAGSDAVLGTLRVPEKHFREFAAAERYLSRDAESMRILDKLEHAKHEYRIDFIANGNDRFEGSDTIAWDPHSALRTTSGGRQTPALGLLHEEDHAYEREINARRQGRLLSEADCAYDNREERRVIAGVETRAATALGEGVRTDHAGVTYAVASPIRMALA
ncbi:MAG: hypothetical protein ACXWNK_16935 [Vulcanimicrobiaceae bacterium]